jgi:hypothetical protein
MIAIGWATSEADLHLVGNAHELASRGRGMHREMVHEDDREKVGQRAGEIAPNVGYLNGLRVRNDVPE